MARRGGPRLRARRSGPRTWPSSSCFRRAGGRTLVDATARDYGRDASALLSIAARTEVNIVCVTGWNRGDYGDEALQASDEELVAIMLGDLQDGMDGTAARAGVAKLGTSEGRILPVEERIARAVARVQVGTGCPVLTHTTRGTMAHEQLDLLAAEGADLAKVALSHMDQKLDFGLLRELCERGAYVLFDGPSKAQVRDGRGAGRHAAAGSSRPATRSGCSSRATWDAARTSRATEAGPGSATSSARSSRT